MAASQLMGFINAMIRYDCCYTLQDINQTFYSLATDTSVVKIKVSMYNVVMCCCMYRTPIFYCVGWATIKFATFGLFVWSFNYIIDIH